MLRKIWEAKLTDSEVVLWGDGSPLREFTFSVDIANILLFLLENYDDPTPVNIGSTGEISIAALAHKICNIMEYDYNKVEWDVSKPAGQYRKPSSNQKLLDLGWKQEDYTDFDDGLEASCAWFTETYPNIRGY
jgi:GDP-L-fucose synthase